MANAYDGIRILIDICLLIFKIIFYTFEGIYRSIVPVEEKNVSGDIVLITGAGHGIGRELALKYASLGATVICWDLNPDGNQETIDQIKQLGTASVYAYQCNVSNHDEVFKTAAKVTAEVGHPTIVVNNAGIMPTQLFLDYKPETVKKIMDVNLLGNIWVLQAFLPNMLANNHGHIVAISSMAGVIGLKNLSPYCASKFAVRGLMESLREEYLYTAQGEKCNVNFTTIYPYMVNTGLCKKPRFRFPLLMSLNSPQETAEEIVKAQRRNYYEVSIPRRWLPINTILRNFPENVIVLVKEFLDSGVDAEC